MEMKKIDLVGHQTSHLHFSEGKVGKLQSNLPALVVSTNLDMEHSGCIRESPLLGLHMLFHHIVKLVNHTPEFLTVFLPYKSYCTYSMDSILPNCHQLKRNGLTKLCKKSRRVFSSQSNKWYRLIVCVRRERVSLCFCQLQRTFFVKLI